jgi:fibronectin-binding autotransporter adhesin
MKRLYAKRCNTAIIIFAVIGLCLYSCLPTRAAVTTSGSIYESGTNYYIGYNADGTLGIDAGSLLNKTNSYLGFNSTCTGTATVSGTNSKWANSKDLYIGNYGVGTLNIQAGGQVNNAYGYIGNYSGSRGIVTVTDIGSIWTCLSPLDVGNSGQGTLNIQAGGKVSSYFGSIGSSLSSTGTATVNGTGSTWSNNSNLFIGSYGNGTLNIQASGKVSNTDTAYLGYCSSSAAGSAFITGTGSTWSNNRQLYIGYAGSGTVNIQDGGQVSVRSDSYLGYMSGSMGTTSVTGMGTTWTTSSYLFVGYSGSGTLNIQSGGQVACREGYLADKVNSTGAVIVDGTGSTFTNYDILYVGDYGSGNLNIQAGGVVVHPWGGGGFIGHSSSSTGIATVMGTGSTWVNNSGSICVGEFGNGTLNIQAGGKVSCRGGSIGYHSGSTGTVTVTGSGSNWTNTSGLNIGHEGNGSLIVVDGGSVTATELDVGEAGNGSLTVANGGSVTAKSLYCSWGDLHGNGNISVQGGAVLDSDLIFDGTHGFSRTFTFGTGGTLNLNFDGTGVLGVGHKGMGTLRIADGVTVISNGGCIANAPGSTGTATVTGSGSKWTNSSTLYVGNAGNGTLSVLAGGQVGNSGDIYVGNAGNGAMNILNGGQVSSAGGLLGEESGATGTVTVSGTGSMWNCGGLYVGAYYGSGTLNILGGGLVSCLYGSAIGYSGTARSTGTVTVNGTGSMWNNNAGLTLGFNGSGTLNIQAGGQVRNSDGYVSDTVGSSGTVTVSGTGSEWINTGSLHLGSGGNGTLNIQDGGQVNNANAAFVGGDLSSSGTGTVTVNGLGSNWTDSGALYIGASGKGSVSILDGGQVSSYDLYLGYTAGCNGTAIVSGTGSKLSGNTIYIAATNAIGNLTVADGGKAIATCMMIKTQTGFRLHVSGNDMLVLGNALTPGFIFNYGAINLYADAFLPATTYTPISEYARRPIDFLRNGCNQGLRRHVE